jgi:hypothetical protein
MIYTIFQEQGLFGVDRQYRVIDLSSVDPEIQIVQWDTERETGIIEYDPTVTVDVQERDFDAERIAETEARENNWDVSKLQPIYKTVQIRKPNHVLKSFAGFEHLLPLWEAAEPIVTGPTAEQLAERQRLADMEDEVRTGAVGQVTPETAAELRAMTRLQLRDWFNTNITDAVAVKRLVRWMFFFVIRRL